MCPTWKYLFILKPHRLVCSPRVVRLWVLIKGSTNLQCFLIIGLIKLFMGLNCYHRMLLFCPRVGHFGFFLILLCNKYFACKSKVIMLIYNIDSERQSLWSFLGPYMRSSYFLVSSAEYFFCIWSYVFYRTKQKHTMIMIQSVFTLQLLVLRRIVSHCVVLFCLYSSVCL
jgi:hypothetical protein